MTACEILLAKHSVTAIVRNATHGIQTAGHWYYPVSIVENSQCLSDAAQGAAAFCSAVRIGMRCNLLYDRSFDLAGELHKNEIQHYLTQRFPVGDYYYTWQFRRQKLRVIGVKKSVVVAIIGIFRHAGLRIKSIKPTVAMPLQWVQLFASHVSGHGAAYD